jgi:hypothetical protein
MIMKSAGQGFAGLRVSRAAGQQGCGQAAAPSRCLVIDWTVQLPTTRRNAV